MKTKIITYLLCLAMLPMFGQAPDITWQQCIGTPTENAYFNHMVKIEGGYLIAYRVSEGDTMISNFHGKSDAWLVKTDSVGNILWERCYGGTEGDFFRKIIPTSNNQYFLFGISESYDGDVLNTGPHGYWVVKIDSLGNILWENSYGNDRCSAKDADLTPDGGLVMLGRTSIASGDVSTYYGLNDLWLCKIDSTGNLEWEKTLGNQGNENAIIIKVTQQNTILLTGGFTDTGGMIPFEEHGWYDVWVVELDLNGNILHQFSYGGSHDNLGRDIIRTEDGFVIAALTNSNDGDVTGYHGVPGDDQPYDCWIIKTDFEGNIQWQKCLGGSETEYPFYLTQTQDGGYIFIGLTHSNDGDVSGLHDYPPYYDDDIWMVKLSSEGELEWQHCYGTYYRESFDFSIHPILKLSDDNFVIGVQTQPSVGGDKTCYRDYSPGLQYWPRMAWLFNLKNCSNYQPTTPQSPTGPDTLCHTTDTTSVYTLAPAAGAWGYTWQLHPEEAGTLAQDSLTATINWNTGYQGEVQISASSYNDCGQSAFSEVKTTFVYTCVGVEEYAAGGFGLRVYPNPAKEWVTFNYTLAHDANRGIISISDMAGKEIQRFAVSGKQGQYVWDTREIKSGVYICTLSAGKLVASKKLIVK